WGGALADFDEVDHFGAAWSAVRAPSFAGYLGLIRGPEGWAWAEGGGIEPATYGWCDPAEARRPIPYAEDEALALVRRADGWGLGRPADAGPPYEEGEGAHFVCERPAPDPAEHQVPPAAR